MTEEEMKRYRSVFEADKKQRQEEWEQRRQKAVQRREEGAARPCDYIYFQDEAQKNIIAHKDDRIAHPDAMKKTPATILLVVGMLGSLIFKQWYLIWTMLLWWYFSKDRV